MSSETTLKLVRSDKSRRDVLPFERRHANRRKVSGRVTAIRTTPDNPDSRTRICSLEMKDMSDTGMGALCQEPIEFGMKVTVFIPPHGPERGYDLCGHITRCEPSEYGFLVGLAFDQNQSMSRSAS